MIAESKVVGHGVQPGKMWLGLTAVPPPTTKMMPWESLNLAGYQGTGLINLTDLHHETHSSVLPAPFTDFQPPERYRTSDKQPQPQCLYEEFFQKWSSPDMRKFFSEWCDTSLVFVSVFVL
jgi:hypothetical protein